jgi:SPP1 gp7 family putative phage head morphogenesis protein
MAKKAEISSPRGGGREAGGGETSTTRREPGKTTVITQPITIGQLNRGNQSIQRWISNVKMAESLLTPQRRMLYETYLDVSIDGYVDALIDKRTRALKITPIEWMGLENDKIKENLKGPWMMQLMDLCGKRISWGTTLAESKLGRDGLIECFELIPHQNVMPERGVIMKDGYTYTEGTNVIYYREGMYANRIIELGGPRELGKLAMIAGYILLKRANLGDFSRYNEMFGMDLRVYEYEPSKPGARAEAERSAKEYGSAAYIVLPKGSSDVKFIGSNAQSSALAYDKLHDLLNKEITISILGQSLTTGGEGGGSYNLGKVHMEIQDEIAMEDRLWVEYMLNYQLKKNILIPNGYPLEGITAAFKVPDKLPKELKANMWIALAKNGLPIAKEDFYKEFGVPMPGDREVLVVSPTGGPQGGAEGGNDPDDDDEPTTGGNKPTPPAPKKPGGAPAKKQLSGSAHLTTLRAYYASTVSPLGEMPKAEGGKSRHARGVITLSYTDELNTIIDSIIERIRNGSLKPGDVDQALYELTGDRLFTAVEKGYGTPLLEAVGADATMLKALQQNVYRFSGFKSYQFVLEANALLKDAEGNLKTFDAFRSDILALNREYNINHLRTEYNHAKAVSRMASKWQKFEEDQGTLPLLMFDAVNDKRTRPAHAKLDGIIKPVNDPFWNKWLPPLDYNCRCTVRQLAEGEITAITPDGEPKPGFGVNWGKDRVVFPPSHPQFDVLPEDQQKADEGFGLTIPE